LIAQDHNFVQMSAVIWLMTFLGSLPTKIKSLFQDLTIDEVRRPILHNYMHLCMLDESMHTKGDHVVCDRFM
jgi:hypothetical protein